MELFQLFVVFELNISSQNYISRYNQVELERKNNPNMKNKFAEQASQNQSICGKKRKINDFETKEDLKIFQNSSKKLKWNFNQKLEDNLCQAKMFKCEICPSNFRIKSRLKRHIESVHEGKIFKCEICPSNFTQNVYLKKHIDLDHGQ